MICNWEWGVERLAFTLLFVAVWLGLDDPPLRWVGIGLFAVSLALELRRPRGLVQRDTSASPSTTSRRNRVLSWLGRRRRNWIFRGVVATAIGIPVIFDLGWWPYRLLALVVVVVALVGEIGLGPPPTAGQIRPH